MKRGDSGLSLLIAVNKPSGMSSHDVVNRCRRIFGERRVGHTGTLDPLAQGVLPICIGPATRLDRFMTGHDKSYRVTLGFGFETTTDDREGEPTAHGLVDQELLTGAFASDYISGLVGARMQVPPAYSAIKVQGKKAYELARKGQEVALEPRPIEIYRCDLVDRFQSEGGQICWVVDCSVSKGTYIRALVRDIGRELGARAHVVGLERMNAGAITLEECMTLETIEALGTQAAIDPVRALGFRFAYGDNVARFVESGNKLREDQLTLYENELDRAEWQTCSCTNELYPSDDGAHDGELISVIVENRLKALYRFDDKTRAFRPACVFSIGVSRR